MAFNIEFVEMAIEELAEIKAFYKAKILDEIEKQLLYEPTKASKNKKCLISAAPKFEFEAPLWELRVGEYRVFYDVNPPLKKVLVRAVRRKQPDQTTEELLQ